MIRINTSGCGWSITGNTYSCTGIPKLDPVFQHTPMDMEVVQNPAYQEVDRYDKIPQHIEGFVMTLTPIIDMSGGSTGAPEVPELACRVNFDPFVTGATCVLNSGSDLTVNTDTVDQGFLDLYNQVEDYTKQFYVVSKASAMVTGGTYHMTSETDFPVYGSTAIMAPGTLEPMLDTMFGPVDIDMPPTPDLTTDAIIYSLAGLQSWRHTIDTRVSNTYVNASETGMANLQNALNQRGGCSQFNIEVIPAAGSTFAPVIGAPSITSPYYEITGGDVVIDGTTVTDIQGTTTGLSWFDAYLDVFEYSETSTSTVIKGATVTVTTTGPGLPIPDTSPYNYKHLKFEYIGSVRPVTTAAGPITGSTAWRLYEIEQGDCIYEITIGGGTGGGGGGTYEYDGPFKVEVSSDASGVSVTVTGIDKIKDNDNWKTMAGHITFGGLWDSGILADTWTKAFPTAQLLDNGEADVFLRVASLTTTTTTTTEDEITTPVTITDDQQNQIETSITEVVYSTSTDVAYNTEYTYYVNAFPGWPQPEPEEANQTITVTEGAPYIVRLARITGIAMDIDHTETTGTATQDHVMEGTVPTRAEDLAGQDAVVTYNTTSAEGPAATITGGTVHLVSGGTCTGYSVVDGTVSVWYKASGGNVKQVQHGDVYVDGRWL